MDKPGNAPPNQPPVKIFTIGHGSRNWEEFVALLQENGIEVVADIRRFPGSRAHPQFGQQQMAEALGRVGIEYVHLPELGGRRPATANSPNTSWRNPSFRGYADYMETDAFREGIDRLTALARARRTAYMCSETVWWRCHRSMVSDYLQSLGWEVWHILGPGDVKPHHFTEPARVVGGRLTYRPEGEQSTEDR
ncbi:MAG TPA: DUF488 domain-containing protein [Thermomicrobiales bacterium]|nr:DUF488 domain-containing protein [Thermomicrobiales bacterium]